MTKYDPNYQEKYRKKNPKRYTEGTKRWRARTRAALYAMYGPNCALCRVSDTEVLSIDHIHGGGKKHLREAGNADRMYKEMLLANDPTLYRVLCMNCQWKERRRLQRDDRG